MKFINFKDKHFKLGGYSVLLTTLFIAFLIIFNMIFSSLDIKIDLTKDKFFSLSDQTLSVIESIDDPVTIYVLEETGQEDADFRDILMRYSKENSNINIVYKDPILYPAFAQSYLDPNSSDTQVTIPTGSIIVENDVTGKYKIVLYYELFNLAYNQNTGSPYVQSLAIEQQITTALDYVTNEIERTIYITSGHGEYSVPNQLLDQFAKENFEVEYINLLTQDIEHSPYNTLLIYSPHSDFSDSETDKILEFLDDGGKALIFTESNTPELENFNKIINYYGLELQTGTVVEGSQDHMLSPYPVFTLPDILEHEITSPIINNNSAIVMPLASGLRISDTPRKSLTFTPLLSSSDNSWLKTDPNAETIEKEPNDIEGPISMAYLIEDNNYLNEKDVISTRLLVISNTVFLDNRQVNLSATANIDFVMNGLLWLQGKEQSMYVRPKTLTNYTLNVTSSSTVLTLAAIALIIIPLIVLIAGVITWRKRRHL